MQAGICLDCTEYLGCIRYNRECVKDLMSNIFVIFVIYNDRKHPFLVHIVFTNSVIVFSSTGD